jgi:hypothetical protein
MAKEYPGVLLLIAAILRSTAGLKLLLAKKNSTFAYDDVVSEWIELVETLLMWEVWLKCDQIAKRHVKRAEKKHRFIMYLLQKTANRQAGMGLKLTKFYTIVHMATDTLHFGMPMCFDMGSNKAGHKPMKKAANVTQKRKDLFDEQVGQRMAEVHALDLAHEEMPNGRLLWEYANEFHGNTSSSTDNTTVHKDPHGSVFGFLTDEMGKRHYSLLGGMLKGAEKAKIATSYLHFVLELQEKVESFAPDLRVYSTVVRNSTIYRGTPWYKNGPPWYDWVMVNWGEEEGVLPAKIWGFVDFRMAKPHSNDVVNFGESISNQVFMP